MKPLKRNIWKELWWNRPTVFLPEVYRWMEQFPYNHRTHYFKDWLWECIFLNWRMRGD